MKALPLKLACSTILLAASVITPGAQAAEGDSPDLAEIASTVKSLKARVEALEAQNWQLKREVATAQAHTSPRKVASVSPTPTGAAASASAGTYAMAARAPTSAREVPNWAGFYAGASFGIGLLGARENVNSSSTYSTTLLNGTSNYVEPPPTNSVEDVSSRQRGAIVALSLGHSWMLGDNFVGGVQVEGGLSNIQIGLSGSSTAIPTSSTGPYPGSTTGNSGYYTTGTTSDVLANRWHVSALARAGWLVDPQDLVYVIGGWSYADFEWSRSVPNGPSVSGSFGLNGATIGAGFERQITPAWTVKAEYRYTKFQDTTVNAKFTATNNLINCNSLGVCVQILC